MKDKRQLLREDFLYYFYIRNERQTTIIERRFSILFLYQK